MTDSTMPSMSKTSTPLKILTIDDLRDNPDFWRIEDALPDWKRPPASFVLDLSNGTYGKPTLGTVQSLMNFNRQHAKGIYKTSLRDQIVYGSHHFQAIVGNLENIQFQGIENAASTIRFHIEHQHLPERYKVPRLASSEGNILISYDRVQSEDVYAFDGPVFFGTPTEPANWGMWLLQGIPSAWTFVKEGQIGTLLTWASSDFQKELLSFIGVRHERITHQNQWRTYFCKEISFLQYSNTQSLAIRQFERDIYAEIIERCHSNEPRSDYEMIFVSRASGSGKHRALINEPELCLALSAMGFALIEPEKYSFADQVNIFNDAKVVVGLGGAGMFNTVFCKPKTSVVSIESSMDFANNHATLFGSMDLRYGFIFGSKDPTDDRKSHYNWYVDVPAVVEALKAFIN